MFYFSLQGIKTIEVHVMIKAGLFTFVPSLFPRGIVLTTVPREVDSQTLPSMRATKVTRTGKYIGTASQHTDSSME